MAEQAVEKELEPDQVVVGDEVFDQQQQKNDILVNNKGEEITAAAADEEDDERVVESQADKDEDITDLDPAREAIRQRRREEKARKRENFRTMQRELQSRDAVINRMREELNVLQRKAVGGEVAQIDAAIKQTSDAYDYFKRQIQEGTERADGVAVANATEKLMQTQAKFSQLNQIKQGYQRHQSQPAPLDPRITANAQAWMEKNDWYDPAARDEDSDMMKTVDNRLAAENWDPTTPEYWAELSRRGKKFLPHRFVDLSLKQGNNQPNKPRQTVAGSGREGGGGGSGGAGFVLSAARVQAIKEAGAWDDPKRRADMITRFKDYDRSSRSQN